MFGALEPGYKPEETPNHCSLDFPLAFVATRIVGGSVFAFRKLWERVKINKAKENISGQSSAKKQEEGV
jgi:hypothetical protein